MLNKRKIAPRTSFIKNIEVEVFEPKIDKKEILIMIPVWFGSIHSPNSTMPIVKKIALKESRKNGMTVVIPKFAKGVRKEDDNSWEWMQIVSNQIVDLTIGLFEENSNYKINYITQSFGGVNLISALQKIHHLKKHEIIGKSLLICPTFSFRHKNDSDAFVNMNHNLSIQPESKKERFSMEINQVFNSINEFSKIKHNFEIISLIPELDWQSRADDVEHFLGKNENNLIVQKANHVFTTGKEIRASLTKKNNKAIIKKYDKRIEKNLKQQLKIFIKK